MSYFSWLCLSSLAPVLTWLHKYFTMIPDLRSLFPIYLTCHSSPTFSIRTCLSREGYSYYWIFISNDLPLSLYHSYIIRNFLTLSLSLFSKDHLEYLIQPLAICIYDCVSLPAAPNSQLLSTAGQLPNTSITEWSNSCLFPGPHKRDMTAPPIKENMCF